MATIDNFRAALNRRGGPSRQHRWQVVINIPTFAGSQEDSRDLSLMALTTQTPVMRLGQMDLTWGGRIIPLPGDREFEMIPITFIATESHFEHDIFERWQEAANGSLSNAATQSLNDILRSVEMQLLDGQDNVVKTYTLRDAWPQEVGQIELDQQAQNSFGQFTVNMQYVVATNSNSL